MSKRMWKRPMTTVQSFETNEYVSSCFYGTVECRYPGRSSRQYDDYGTGLGKNMNTYVDSDGNWHGLCGNVADITIIDIDGVGHGYEMSGGSVQTNRPIQIPNAKDYTQLGVYSDITYYSTENNWQSRYTHVGKLVVKAVSNHS